MDPATPAGPSANPSAVAAVGSPSPTTPAPATQEEGENDNNIGVANEEYFAPGPATNLRLRRVMVERTMTPDILVHGLVTPADVEELFKMSVRFFLYSTHVLALTWLV